MLFNSYGFIALFIPIVCTIYYFLNHYKCYKLAQFSLIAASFFFYGYGNPALCILLLGSILVNFGVHVLLVNKLEQKGGRKILVLFALVFNLGLLFYFKYLTFVLTNMNRFFETDFVLQKIVLPLGISFFTFQQISFIIDSGKVGMERYSFMEYALFVCFFPQLVAGPIVLHQEMIPQFRDLDKKKLSYQNLTEGIEYFIIGLVKKVLVADSFGRICDAGLANLAELNSMSAILTSLAFTIQIYFDFSGYCDMAIGLGRMLNIHIPINFDAPYKALNIDEFWKRWHITLSRFLTTYLYIPLGGNRKGICRTYINIMIVFLLSGIWHGAGWNYFLWGAMHGLMKVVYRMGRKFWDRLPRLILWLSTFSFVSIAWSFFRADYLRQPISLLGKMLTGGVGRIHEKMTEAVTAHFLPAKMLEVYPEIMDSVWLGQGLIIGWFLVCIAVCVFAPTSHEIVNKQKGVKIYVMLGCLFVWAFFSLSQISKFIYFNF